MSKYTDEQVALMLESYKNDPSKETIDDLAEKLDKSARSIIGKLSRLGVYKKVPYSPKYAEEVVTKEELVARIADYLDLDSDLLMGLAKSQKPALLYLEESLKVQTSD